MAPRWRTGVVTALALVTAAVPFLDAAPASAATVHPIHFPVASAVRFTSSFGADRDGGARHHEGNDLMGTRLDHVLAATDGTVIRAATTTGNAGNYLVIKAPDGWQTKYMHLNNDTPGTDDGANPAQWRFAPGIGVGSKVKAGQFIAYLGDSGNAETTAPHLHFELHAPAGVIDPWPSLRHASAIPAGTTCQRATNPSSDPDPSTADAWQPPTWTATRTGQVAGRIPAFGDLAGRRLVSPIVDLAARPTNDGYWMLGADGGVFSFGAAPFLGSTGGRRLNQPIVGLAPTSTGNGYWLVAADGGIFAFGDAPFLGSTGSLKLNEPIVDVAPTPSGHGYWLLGRDGGLFGFGDAGWHGSVPGTGACDPIVATKIGATPTGRGYWIQSADGRVWSFGDAATI